MKQATVPFSKRIKFILAGIFVWSAIIAFKLVNIQIVNSAGFKARTRIQHHAKEVIPAHRGEVLDANGKVLAITRMEPMIFADPEVVEEPRAFIAEIAKVLNEDRRWISDRTAVLKQKKNAGSRYLVISKSLTTEQNEELKKLDLKGLHFRSTPRRAYPKQWLASHVLGFLSPDGAVSEGLEHYYDDILKGRNGVMRISRDGRRKRNELGSTILQEPVHGASVKLTLDENIQFFLENALRRGMAETGADNVTGIIMDPYTGAIHAMANMPDFNPNAYSKTIPLKRKNRSVVDAYEPASAFKIITVAAALDLGRVTLDRVYDCENGGIQVHDKWIRDNGKYGHLSVRKILWESSNVGSIKIAGSMKNEEFQRYIAKFGFGAKSNIDLPAEGLGIFHPLEEWSLVSSAYLSFGHEISATPLQMLAAACAVANGGLLVQPYIGKQVIYRDGRTHDLTPETKPKRVITKHTSNLMKDALEGVVEHGTAKAAKIPGVRVLGKTGTAQRLQGHTYSREKFNASFVGFFPAEKPRYGIIVVVNNPKKGKVHGGEVAAPIFAEVGRQIVLYEKASDSLGKARIQVSAHQLPSWQSKPLESPETQGAMPDLHGLGLRNALLQLKLLGVKAEIVGDGRVIRQVPESGASLPENGVCKLILKEG